MTGDEAAPPGAASYVYAAGARSRAGVAKGIADMQNKVDEVFVGKVRLLSIDGERSGIVKTPAAGPLMLTPTGLEGDEQADLRASAALLLLEQAAFRRQLLLAQDEVKQKYLKVRGIEGAGMDKANKTLQEILASSGFLSRPAELLGSSGYGLPQAKEWEMLESESSQRQQQLLRLTGDLDKEVRSLLEPARAAEIAATEANVKQIGEHLRAIHKASGGLQLP